MKSEDGTVIKAYVCLFTCATVRAVHFELCRGLDAFNFFSAFRKFIARRGIPSKLISDNAQVFARASRELKCLNKFLGNIKADKEINGFLVSHNIEWQFNIPRAPWWGGFFERLMRNLKMSLKKCIGRNRVSYHVFECFLLESEAVINSRPLTYVESADDAKKPLTPADFLLGRRITALPTPNDLRLADPNIPAEGLVRLHELNKRHLSGFWNRWRKEYLLSLREHHMSCKRNNMYCNQVHVGDIVIVGDDQMPRLMWKMGRIIEVLPSRDGRIRAVKLQTTTPRGAKTELTRPINKLYPLEIGTS